MDSSYLPLPPSTCSHKRARSEERVETQKKQRLEQPSPRVSFYSLDRSDQNQSPNTATAVIQQPTTPGFEDLSSELKAQQELRTMARIQDYLNGQEDTRSECSAPTYERIGGLEENQTDIGDGQNTLAENGGHSEHFHPEDSEYSNWTIPDLPTNYEPSTIENGSRNDTSKTHVPDTWVWVSDYGYIDTTPSNHGQSIYSQQVPDCRDVTSDMQKRLLDTTALEIIGGGSDALNEQAPRRSTVGLQYGRGLDSGTFAAPAHSQAHASGSISRNIYNECNSPSRAVPGAQAFEGRINPGSITPTYINGHDIQFETNYPISYSSPREVHHSSQFIHPGDPQHRQSSHEVATNRNVRIRSPRNSGIPRAASTQEHMETSNNEWKLKTTESNAILQPGIEVLTYPSHPTSSRHPQRHQNGFNGPPSNGRVRRGLSDEEIREAIRNQQPYVVGGTQWDLPHDMGYVGEGFLLREIYVPVPQNRTPFATAVRYAQFPSQINVDWRDHLLHYEQIFARIDALRLLTEISGDPASSTYIGSAHDPAEAPQQC